MAAVVGRPSGEEWSGPAVATVRREARCDMLGTCGAVQHESGRAASPESTRREAPKETVLLSPHVSALRHPTRTAHRERTRWACTPPTAGHHEGGAWVSLDAQPATLRDGSPTLFERRTQHAHGCVRYGQRDATRPRPPCTARYRLRDPRPSVLRLVPMYHTQV